MTGVPLLPPSRRPRVALVLKRSAWRIFLEENAS